MKPYKLNKGDKVAIVCLSLGLLGEEGASHELEIGIKRLKEMGLVPVIMPNSVKGIEYLFSHPEERAKDLKDAFMDKEIKGIITAIGGDDTYKTIPYLMDDEEFINCVKNNPKLFTGFSDTTNNHLMFNRLGLSTFYGPCFLVDIAELDKEMLPYTLEYFNKYFMEEDSFEIKSSPIWYSDRESYDKNQVGVPRIAHKEMHGYETINGKGKVTGKLYGGCIESIYNAMVGNRYADTPGIYLKYHLFPSDEEWTEKILFIESSEEKVEPEKLYQMLMEFKKRGIFRLVRGIIVGKPIDEKYYEEYKSVYKEVFSDLETPILYNVNFGHAYPRCIIPYDALATIDYDNKKIYINSPIFEKGKNKIKVKN